MSSEQKKYVKKLKLRRYFVLVIQIIIVMGFFIIWELLANKNIINTFVFSKPSEIWQTILNLVAQNNLFNHIFTTLNEVLIAFILGILLGFIVAIILYEIPILADIVDPFLTMINSLPKVALGPLIIIIAGANTNSIIVMALLINLIVSIITIYNGFLNIDDKKIKLLKSFGATKMQILTHLVIPSSYKTIISSLKLNISMSLIGLLPPVGENLNSNKYCSKYLSHYL